MSCQYSYHATCKIYSNHFIRIWKGSMLNSHQICFVMETLLVKWLLGKHEPSSEPVMTCHDSGRKEQIFVEFILRLISSLLIKCVLKLYQLVLLTWFGADFILMSWYLIKSCWQPFWAHFEQCSLDTKTTMNKDVMIWAYFSHHFTFLWEIQQFLVIFLHKGAIMQHFAGFFVVSMDKLLNKHCVSVQWNEMP